MVSRLQIASSFFLESPTPLPCLAINENVPLLKNISFLYNSCTPNAPGLGGGTSMFLTPLLLLPLVESLPLEAHAVLLLSFLFVGLGLSYTHPPPSCRVLASLASRCIVCFTCLSHWLEYLSFFTYSNPVYLRSFSLSSGPFPESSVSGDFLRS